jgi:hypothetical protein
MLLPTPDHFAIRYDGSKDSLTKAAKIVARLREIDINETTIE